MQKSYSGGKAPRCTVANGLIGPAAAQPDAVRARDVGPSRWYLAMVQDVIVNGEPHAIEEGSSVADLLRALGLDAQQVAVERNREIVPREAHAQTPLTPGDRLEIVTFVGGG